MDSIAQTQPEFSLIELDGQKDNLLSLRRERTFQSRSEVREYFRTRGHEQREDKDGPAVLPQTVDWSAPQCTKPATIPWAIRSTTLHDLARRGVQVTRAPKTGPDGTVYEAFQAPFCEIYAGQPVHRRARGAWFIDSPAWCWLDFDDVSSAVYVALQRGIQARGWDAATYTTHGHGADPSIAKFRLCIFTAQRYPAADVPIVRRAVARALAGMVKHVGVLPPDSKTFDYTRLFYKPAAPASRWNARELWFSADEGATDLLDLSSIITDEDRRSTRAAQVRREKKLELGVIAEDGEELEPPSEAQRLAARAGLAAFATLVRAHPKSGLQAKLHPGASQPVQRLASFAAAGALALDTLQTELRLAIEFYCDAHKANEARRIDLANLVSRSISKGLENPELPLTDAEAEEIEAAIDAADESGIARVRTQLRSQTPERELTLAEAEAALGERVERFAFDRNPVVIAAPPGLGKSDTVLQNIARHENRTNLFGKNHRLLEQHRRRLGELGAAPDVAHQRSPLSAVGNAPVCLRADELNNTVREHRIDLRKSVCPRCPHRETCAAFADVADPRARLMLAPVAGAASVLEREERKDAATFVDEEPELFEQLTVSEPTLRKLVDCPPGSLFFSLVTVEHEVALRELATAYLEGREPRAVQVKRRPRRRKKSENVPSEEDLFAGAELPDWVDPRDIAVASRGQLHASDGQARSFNPDLWEKWPWFSKAAHALFRLATLYDRPVLREGVVQAIAPSRLYEAIRSGRALLLSATPTTCAYPGFELYRPSVKDGCQGITRELHYRCRSTTTALRPERKPRLDAIARDLRAMRARTQSCKRVLLVTFSWLVDFLKSSEGERLIAGWPVELAWYGAVAGLNAYQEGGELECDAFVTYGDFRPGVEWLLGHLAHHRGVTLDDREAWIREQWREMVADEGAQAHGRARDIRRRTPCLHLHFGRVAPRWWHEGNTQLVLPTAGRPPLDRDDASPLQAALAIWSANIVAQQLGVSRQAVSKWARGARIPDERLAQLRELTRERTLEELFAPGNYTYPPEMFAAA